MTARSLVVVLPLIAVLSGCGQRAEPSAVPVGNAELKRLRAVDPNASRLLDGGVERYETELANLRGTPVVVNQWASWCGPCKFEFPFFQRQAKLLRGQVAFLGVNSKDSTRDAEAFLAEYPTPYGHVEDRDGDVARSYGGGRAWPTTVFYNAQGQQTYLHQGVYRTEAALRKAIDRYALGG